MNILLDGGLPEEIGGYPIYPDFRNMIQFERALADEKLPDAAKVYAGFQLLFEKIPPDFDDAVQKLFWFYCGGADETEAENANARPWCMRRGPMISIRMRR